MQLTIVLDSNIWLKEHMLRHSTGSAVRFFLRKRGARVVVPEVVRLEVEYHLERQLIDLASQIRDGHVQLLRVVGKLKELVLPTDEELRAVAKNAFEEARVEITEIPFSLCSARSSFEKCILSVPPSGPKNQQFNVGVIWADCLKLAEESPVHFVTEDKAFYDGRDYNKGLAANLSSEAAAVPHEISIAHEIRSILDRIGEPIKLDYSDLHEKYFPKIKEETEQLLSSEGYTLGELSGGEHAIFATDDPEIAHVEFSLQYDCIHPSGRKGTLIAKGECIYLSSTGDLSEFHNRGEEFKFEGDAGEQQKKNIVIGVANMVLGHRTITYDVRAPID